MIERNEYDLEKVLRNILICEEEFPVNDWKINGVYIWPYIRTTLAYTQRFDLNAETVGRRKLTFFKVLRKFGISALRLPAHWLMFMIRIRSANRLFLGAVTHRVKVDGKLVNKYFDKSVDRLNELGDKTLILDFGSSLNSEFYPNRSSWFSLPSLYILCELRNRLVHSREDYKIELNGYDNFFKRLQRDFKNPEILSTEFSERAMRIKMKNFHNRKQFLKSFLQKSNVKNVYFLCYYSSIYYPLIAASNELSINTVDIQHGGMGTGHWSYDQWTRIPEGGYSLLPRFFWSWDEGSKQLINKWARHSTYHKALKMGTPWMQDVRRLNYHPEWRDYILVNLIDYVLEDYLLKVIKKIDTKVKWILRMHPRQMHKKAFLESQLSKSGIYEGVTIEDSTEVPLIDSLQHCSVFMSASSGSIIEAINAGLHPILLPSTGSNYYDQYIESGELIPLGEKSEDSLIKILEAHMGRVKIKDNEPIQTYKSYLKFEEIIASVKG